MGEVFGSESEGHLSKKMKRHGNLFEQIVSADNLNLAYRNARKGKSWQRVVQEFDNRSEVGLAEIRKQLVDGKYQTSQYRIKEILKPKRRIIYVLPFAPDRIVQHAIVQILEPIWDRVLLAQSFACRKQLGLHRASNYAQSCVQKYKYCLQMDIRKFYPSVDHQILFSVVQQKIKCKRTLMLIKEIISSAEGCPIGNYTSQWFGNLYLNELDQYLKHKYRIKGYCRYVDDFLIFGDSKEWLQFVRVNIVDFLKRSLKLEISRWSLKPVETGVDFVGYRHFPTKKLLRKSTAKQMIQRISELKKNWPACSSIRFRSTLASYEGWASWANTYHLLQTLEITKLKEIIGMRGIPKHLNTKFDYEYIKNQNLSGWQTQYQALLDNRLNWFKTADLSPDDAGITDATHRVRTEKNLDGATIKYQQELQEDPNCKLFRLGFTQTEVESALTV